MKSVRKKQGGIKKNESAIYIKFRLDKRQEVRPICVYGIIPRHRIIPESKVASFFQQIHQPVVVVGIGPRMTYKQVIDFHTFLLFIFL